MTSHSSLIWCSAAQSNSVGLCCGLLPCLARAAPLEKPLIHPNYLGVESDCHRLVEGVKLARRIFRTKAFSDWFGTELAPGRASRPISN